MTDIEDIEDPDEIRTRGIRMSNRLHEAVATLAERNGRTIAEEFRVGMEAWVAQAGNIQINEERRTVAPHPNLRPRNRKKK